MKRLGSKGSVKVAILIIVAVLFCFYLFSISVFKFVTYYANRFVILSSYENRDLEHSVKEYASKNGYQVEFVYMGDLDIVDELNSNSSDYDAVWISNSIWLYMLDNSYITSNSKSISISPVVMGIRKSKAEELGLTTKEITNQDLLQLIQNKQIKYVMSSVTQTNTGATAYLGFLNSLAGSPEVLTEDMLNNPELVDRMISVFSGVERVSGDEEYLETMFLNSNEYEAMLASESSLIHINKKLKEKGLEELYLIYPKDGVAINDSTFAFLDHNQGQKEHFLQLQSYLLSKDGQSYLQGLGRRTWYGGTSTSADSAIFNPSWGIDTTKYLVTTKYPSKAVMTKAINLYIEEFRKPTHVVFCLDYSGSMRGEGIYDLRNAMDYILDYEQASEDQLQFSKKDKITILPFSSYVLAQWDTDNGKETASLIEKINSYDPAGNTALYDAITKAMGILSEESDEYTKTIIAMTDGMINVGSLMDVEYQYSSLETKIPVYSITFGEADEWQLQEIADITNARVFNGKTDLLKAFKEVRGYN